MAKKHAWRVKKYFFHQLRRGEKDIEVRVGYPSIQKVKQGDIVSFENYGPNEFEVKRVSVYYTFKEMLETEGVERVLPGMTFEGALKALRNIYPEEYERLGVYAFELQFRTDPSVGWEFIKASDLLRQGENKKFSKVVAESYILTDWISKDYPDHVDHFYSKYVPGVFDGEREIIACYIDNKIMATAFLKKDADERKISTLYVRPECQRRGVATKLLEVCFEWLGTKRPLVTVADYKLDQFRSIISKYGWVETQVLGEGYYNDHSREHVFNGTI